MMTSSMTLSCCSRPCLWCPPTCARCTSTAGLLSPRPLVAKQLLGAHRQFVFGQESRQRWPELALFAASFLAYVAATGSAIPTGFWDRAPRSTAGRLRRVLSSDLFPHDFPLLANIRKKDSHTDHLPKGANATQRVSSAS